MWLSHIVQIGSYATGQDENVSMFAVQYKISGRKIERSERETDAIHTFPPSQRKKHTSTREGLFTMDYFGHVRKVGGGLYIGEIRT